MSNQDIQTTKTSTAAVKSSELAAKIQRNLELMKQARNSETSGEFFKMQSGQKTVLQFTGDFSPELREFPEKDAAGNVIKDRDGNPKVVKKISYEYKVIDLNNQDKGVQTWAVSKNTSMSIESLLAEGFLTLKVSREGADMGTKYFFVPVGNTNSSNSGNESGKGVQ
jgi:hypothetical protein